MSTLLLTGATGSFGRAFTRAALAGRWFSRIIAFSDSETNQSSMRAAFPPSERLEYFLGNVRDVDRLRWAMRARVDVVVHAAALKEVPSCEYNFPEAVATNVDGSRNVCDAAIEAGVSVALLVSTDKAVEATTVYGKTKAMAEEWFTRSNARSRSTRLASVRYGNVLASRGSVLPVFLAKIAAGESLPVTDLQMTRFWWTLDQAVAFVYAACQRVEAGDIWVPKIKAAPMLTLVQALTGCEVPHSRVDVVGIRGMEKLHEALLAADEVRRTVETRDAYVVLPTGASWDRRAPLAPYVSRLFAYRSDNQALWLTVDEMRALVDASASSAKEAAC